jgi:hypothetical protein
MSALRQLVQSQQEVVNKLQRQLGFVLSYLNIQKIGTSRPTDSTGQPCAGGAPNQPDPEPLTTTANINGEFSAGQLAWTKWLLVKQNGRIHCSNMLSLPFMSTKPLRSVMKLA